MEMNQEKKQSTLEDFKYHCEVPLRWKDVDQFGHVNNANYLTFFEIARFFYCRDVCQWNWDIDKFIIASIHVDYLRPIFFPNKTKVYLRIPKIGEKSFEFEYIVTTEKNGVEKIASRGVSVQVMYDLANQKTISVPERLKLIIEDFESGKL